MESRLLRLISLSLNFVPAKVYDIVAYWICEPVKNISSFDNLKTDSNIFFFQLKVCSCNVDTKS